MRVSKEQAAENRERVLQTAARLFRERGFDGIGVADLMKEAGLTHGAFYGQFASKEDLMAQACERALAESHALWQRRSARAVDNGSSGLDALVHGYLSPQHRDQPGRGCMLAALGAEAGRHTPAVRQAMTRGLRPLLDQLAAALPDGGDDAARRRQALAAFAAMVGAQVLARAVDDEALSAEILDAVAATLARPASAGR